MIIFGLIIHAILPDVSTRFFVGGLTTWLGGIFLEKALTKNNAWFIMD